MKKNNYQTLKLEKGEMHVYDYGKIKLYAYRTDDLINDEVFVVEKNNQAVVIESPCFFDNNSALEKFLANKNVAGMLIAYHGAGGNFLPDVSKYATENARQYSLVGGGKALVDNFTNAFGSIFDSKIHTITNIFQEGSVTIGGIEFVITKTAEAYNIVVPEINAVYTHMLGHDCHSIVGGTGHADAIIAELNEYIEKGYDLILTSHYTPEDLNDAKTKIEYLNRLKEIASNCKNAEEFKQAVNKEFPNYSGENYLDMTANMFFA